MAPPQSPQSPPRWVSCPQCNERLVVRAEDVGHRGRCHGCGHVFVIAEPAPPDFPPPQPDLASAAKQPAPATLTFPCELCQTRITVTVLDVGKRVKCPDCGRRNVIPEPAPPPAPPRTPTAMGGQQFEVWGVDDLQSSAKMTARNAALHPVHCSLCGTLMYAIEKQIGTRLKCPDCGTLNTAVRRKQPKPAGPVLVPAGEEYQLDEASAPTPRPVYVSPEVRFAETHPPKPRDNLGADAPARSPSGERMRVTLPQRPKRPRVPLVQGVLPMLLTGDVLVRWFVTTVMLTLVLGMLSLLFGEMGGYAAMYMLPFFAVGCIMSFVWLTLAAPLCLAVVIESSEGEDRLQEPPRWGAMEWFGESLMVVIPAAASAIPAWLVTKIPMNAPSPLDMLLPPAVWMLCFPVMMLSALELGTPLGIFSLRLVASLFRCAGPWLLFFLISAILLAAGAGVWMAATRWAWITYLLPAMGIAAALLYMRLLGRLGWWLAETMPPRAE